MIPPLHLPPQTLPPPSGSPEFNEWFDRVAKCSAACASTIESHGLKPNEVPVVIASLMLALSDHTGVSLENIMSACNFSAQKLKSKSEIDPTTDLLQSFKTRYLAVITEAKQGRREGKGFYSAKFVIWDPQGDELRSEWFPIMDLVAQGFLPQACQRYAVDVSIQPLKQDEPFHFKAGEEPS